MPEEETKQEEPLEESEPLAEENGNGAHGNDEGTAPVKPEANEEGLPEDEAVEPNVDDAGEDDQANDKKKKIQMKVSADAPWSERMWEVFTTFWPLGFVRR